MKSQTNRIVLVDDDPDFKYLVGKALSDSKPSCVLTTLSSGTELLDWLKTNSRPNMIFLDINMPGLTGFDVLKLMRETDHYKAIPVVIFSVLEGQQDIHKSYDIGANAYIIKPMTFDELKKLMNSFSHYWFDVAQTPGSNRDWSDGYSTQD